MAFSFLPWREDEKQSQKKQFTMLGSVGGILLLSALSLHWSIDAQISAQQQQQRFVEEEILATELKINALYVQHSSREHARELIPLIETLQASRVKVIDIFEGLSNNIPSGIYLDSLIRNGSQLILVGVSESALEISQFMKLLSAHSAFKEPLLIETQAIQDNAAAHGLRFHLTVKTFSEEGKEETHDTAVK
jgi:type IV pilus assembly protein PilN